MTSMTDIKTALDNAIVTKDGVEVTDYSECYLALAQDLQETLPDGYAVEWGPTSAWSKRVIDQTPASMWEAACAGSLEV